MRWIDRDTLAAWSRRREAVPLLLLALLAAGVWAFAALADTVVEQEAHAFDRAVLLALRSPGDLNDPLGPRWFEEMGRDLTALGGIAVLTLAAAAAVMYLLLRRNRPAVMLVVAAVGGGWTLSALLKDAFERPRPDLVPHGSIVYSASFPSGHSMMSAVTYLTLAGLMASLHRPVRMKALVLGWALLLTVLTGISRVYLGVHWPTDVLAGWCVGASWAVLCWLVALWLQRRGAVKEVPAQDAAAGGEPATRATAPT